MDLPKRIRGVFPRKADGKLGLVVAAALLIAAAMALAYANSGPKGYCTQLCASEIGSSGGYVYVRMLYDGVEIPNSPLQATLNGRYTARIRTNSTSVAAISAPFGIGRNYLAFKYLQGSSAIGFMYYGGYGYFLFLPIGIVLLLALGYGSSMMESRRAVSIYVDDKVPESRIRDILASSFERLSDSERWRTSGLDLPQTAEALSAELARNSGTGQENRRLDCDYVARRIGQIGIAQERSGFLSRTGLNANIGARKAYDLWVMG